MLAARDGSVRRTSCGSSDGTLRGDRSGRVRDLRVRVRLRRDHLLQPLRSTGGAHDRLGGKRHAALGCAYGYPTAERLLSGATVGRRAAKDCPPKTYCATARLSPAPDHRWRRTACERRQSMSAGSGFCWALPDASPMRARDSVQSPCEPSCIDDWSAIRDGGVYFPVLRRVRPPEGNLFTPMIRFRTRCPQTWESPSLRASLTL